MRRLWRLLLPHWLRRAAADSTYPPLARPLTFADLAGGWGNDDSVVTNYVSYRGDYAGYQSIATKEKWVFDGKGNVSSAFTANVAGQGTARQVNERKKGTVVLSPGNLVTMAWIGAAPASFVIRGWRELPGMTVLLLNGPWYGQVPADVLGGSPDRREPQQLLGAHGQIKERRLFATFREVSSTGRSASP